MTGEATALRLKMGVEVFLRAEPWKAKVVVEMGRVLGEGAGRAWAQVWVLPGPQPAGPSPPHMQRFLPVPTQSDP